MKNKLYQNGYSSNKIGINAIIFLTEEESILKKIQDLFKEKDLKKEANLEMQEWQVKETLKRQKQLKDYPALA